MSLKNRRPFCLDKPFGYFVGEESVERADDGSCDKLCDRMFFGIPSLEESERGDGYSHNEENIGAGG